ncbi:MAG: hypothetical protein WDN01_08690 [Rhizomicrobium sp.]
MSELPIRARRHWIEYVATAAALLISAISLWVAIRTEDANTKMVAAASWPFLQVATSDSDGAGRDILKFDVVNAGVGPALVEYFEVTFDGKPLASSNEMLARCCGFDPGTARPIVEHAPQIGTWIEGNVGGTILRAGEDRVFFNWPRTAANGKAWLALRDAAAGGRLRARACYCSVFNECWQGAYEGLHPAPVDRCVAPKVAYYE